jgi:hypothetical protein
LQCRFNPNRSVNLLGNLNRKQAHRNQFGTLHISHRFKHRRMTSEKEAE